MCCVIAKGKIFSGIVIENKGSESSYLKANLVLSDYLTPGSKVFLTNLVYNLQDGYFGWESSFFPAEEYPLGSYTFVR